MKESKQVLNKGEKVSPIMEKIIRTLSVLKEDKLTMVHQVIKIITGMNRGGADLSSLLSTDGDGIFTPSEKISLNDVDEGEGEHKEGNESVYSYENELHGQGKKMFFLIQNFCFI
jgi:hypothetical protein